MCVCVFPQPGHCGKTVPELEKTIGLMKKVVERVQRENETLKKSSAPANQTKVAALQQENLRLKVQHHLGHPIHDLFGCVSIFSGAAAQ